jgi:predicted PurR-regulated permease PerM
MSNKLNPILKQLFLFILILFIGIMIIYHLRAVINGLLGALALHIILRPLYFRMVRDRGWGKRISASLLLLTSFVVLCLPIALLFYSVITSIQDVAANFTEINATLMQAVSWIKEKTGINIFTPETLRSVSEKLAMIVPAIVNGTAGMVLDIATMYFVLYFTLTEIEMFEGFVRRNLPFRKQNNIILLRELKSQTKANVIGIPLVGLVQGVVAFIAYLIIGLDGALMWAAVTGVASILPFVGTALVWLPIAIYLFTQGQNWQGTTLIAIGAIVITNIDNVVRMAAQKKIGDIHPLVTLLGVIVGLNVFGFIGLVFGPLIISYFFLLVRIYQDEFTDIDVNNDPPKETAK